MRVKPQDKVKDFDAAGSMVDFWQWAFSDLCDDDVKGWFAEWLVAKLLKIETPRRISWANSDLIVGKPDRNLRIEVKASAYWQSYKLLDEFGEMLTPKPLLENARNRVRFSGITARTSTTVAKATDEKLLKSDLYVFAFEKHEQYETWDALNLDQWDFYLATKEQLAGKHSVTLHDLEQLQTGPMTAYEFSLRGREMICSRGFEEYTGSFIEERMADQAQWSYAANADEIV